MRKFWITLLAVTGVIFTGIAEEPIVWEFPAALTEWSRFNNSRIEELADAIKVVPLKGDHGIINPAVDIDPKVYNCMLITYRAVGFRSHTTGEIFFTTPRARRYSEANRIPLPSLAIDGQVHTLVVRLTAPAWVNAGQITSLRLDITNQMPGDVEILRIEMRSVNTGIVDPVWNFADGAGAWVESDRMQVSADNGWLKLDITGNDCHLNNIFEKIDGSKVSKLRIVYRATGFNRRTTGGLFFCTPESRRHTAANFVRFPSLICDGEEHEFTAPVDFKGKEISYLRLDIVDQFPGTVWIKSIEFLP